MLVSIIIINYNTFQLTCDCIKSIREFVKCPYEIILVDNNSPTDEPDDFLKLFADIKLVKSSKNLGFAGGNNLGIEHASGDIILLLNSDTYLIEDCISKATEILSSDLAIGALSIKIIYPDGRFQHTARRFRSIKNEVLDLFRPLIYLIPYKKRAQMLLNQYFKGDFNTECDWVSGAFMMFRRSILEALQQGKLDERYFMYGEDQLWCYQFKKAGYKNYFYSETSVVHISNASTAPDKQLKLLKLFINRELDLMRNRKGSGLYLFLFRLIYSIKDYSRYYLKLFAKKILNYKVR